MSWKKILSLLLFLAVLIAAILLVNHSEKRKQAVEGVLLDFPAADVVKIELRQKDNLFVFSRHDTFWYLDEPLAVKADKVAIENILDNFCTVKYDRVVEESAGDLKDFGLDKPETELKLFAKGKAEPVHTILLGMKNNLDESSYAKLASGNKVVTLAAYKRNELEKDLFAFRDKKFLEFDNMAVTTLDFRFESNHFAFSKKGGQWFMDKPVFSLAPEAKISDILSSASLLEARSFVGPVSADRRRELGLEEPLLTLEFKSTAASNKIIIGRKDEKYYALAAGGNEICEISKDFLEKFGGDATAFREKKVAIFYAFDVKELNFKSGSFAFAVRKNADGVWEFPKKNAGEKPGEEKVNRLLTSLADCEAKEFVDAPGTWPEFPVRVAMKVENAENPGKFADIIMEFSAVAGETVLVRTPQLPYGFKVGKEILEKFPQKMEDIAEGNPKTAKAEE